MEKIDKETEEQNLIEAIHKSLKAKMKALRYFAEEKIEAFEDAELLSSGIRVCKTEITDGISPVKGQNIRVQYTGFLPSGRKFDSGEITFKLGKGEVIKGWEIICKELRLNEEAVVFIPSEYAYGKNGAGKDIKPFTSLIFDMCIKEIF